MSSRRFSRVLSGVVCGLAILLLGTLVFKHLSYPLFWQQEAVTAGFGARVLEHGYPKVHGPKNALYATPLAPSLAIEPSLDAYRAAPWLPYYVAAFAESLAGSEADPWARTGRVRGVFALLGGAAFGVLLVVLLPLVAGDRSRRAWAAAAFLGLCAASVSLQLHVREVGSLAPTLFLLAVALFLLIRRHVQGNLSEPAFALGFGAVLLLLFSCDYAVFAGVAVTEVLLVVRRGFAASAGGGRLRGCGADLLALAVAGVAVAPLVGFFALQEIAAVRLVGEHATLLAYGERLLDLVLHLLRYEWLAPVIVSRLALGLLRVVARGLPHAPDLGVRLAAADLLSLLVLVQLLAIALVPDFFERNAVPLGPVLSVLLVLDGVSLWEMQRAPRRVLRRLGMAGLVLSSFGVLVGLGLRVPELSGRLHELQHRYRGPLDHVIAYLLEHHEDPGRLVVATVAEGSVFAYYLDAYVLVDSHQLTIERDFIFQPELVIPRPGGSTSMLALLAVRASYDQEDLPVENLAFNNVPNLSDRDVIGMVHRFESADLAEGEAGLPILELPRGGGDGL